MNRRQFLILSTTIVTRCQAVDNGGSSAGNGERVVDAGPVSNYATDGLYDAFRDQGFFVIRKGEKLLVLTAICTHQGCTITPEADHSFFYCPCHGSTFDLSGTVMRGPAARNLPPLTAFTNDNGHLLVKIPVS